LSKSIHFKEQVWAKIPIVISAPFAARCLTSKSLSEGLALAEAASIPVQPQVAAMDAHGKWTYTKVGTSHGCREALNSGTVIINEAQFVWPEIGQVVVDLQRAMRLPGNCNIYQTLPGRHQSSPAHTDFHDVFVFQTQGTKHWKVWGPPPTHPEYHQLHRGKDYDDILQVEELGQPILDVVLNTGQMLYVPNGFTHAVSTDVGSVEESVHMTLAVDTYIFSLSYEHACRLCVPTAPACGPPYPYTSQQWALLVEALPFGFLAKNVTCPEKEIALELGRRIAMIDQFRVPASMLHPRAAEIVASAVARMYRKTVEAHDRLHQLAALPLVRCESEIRRRQIRAIMLELNEFPKQARLEIELHRRANTLVQPVANF